MNEYGKPSHGVILPTPNPYDDLWVVLIVVGIIAGILMTLGFLSALDMVNFIKERVI